MVGIGGAGISKPPSSGDCELGDDSFGSFLLDCLLLLGEGASPLLPIAVPPSPSAMIGLADVEVVGCVDASTLAIIIASASNLSFAADTRD